MTPLLTYSTSYNSVLRRTQMYTIISIELDLILYKMDGACIWSTLL